MERNRRVVYTPEDSILYSLFDGLMGTSIGAALANTDGTITEITNNFYSIIGSDYVDTNINWVDLINDYNSMEVTKEDILTMLERDNICSFKADSIRSNSIRDIHVTATRGVYVDLIIVGINSYNYSNNNENNFVDSITSLPNREFIYHKAPFLLASEHKKGKESYVCLLDLSNFKQVNDTFGYSVGDSILKQTGERLKHKLNRRDIVARFGADEFVLILAGYDNQQEVEEILDLLYMETLRPFNVNNTQVFLGCSIGVSKYYDHGSNIGILIRNSDMALRKAKELGHSVQFYYEELSQEVSEQFMLENQLRTAIKKGEIYLNYQPIVDSVTKEIKAAEALIRWENSILGNVRPDRFIHIAERNAQIHTIGEWVLREACKQNKYWQDNGFGYITMSVNVSSKQLKKPGFSEMVKQVLEETGLEPKYLELEITESVTTDDITNLMEILNDLLTYGVSIALDDFGTGYSSLNKIKDLSITKIKIDKSFIEDIEISNESAGLVAAIISMAKGLRLSVVAEGVETVLQAKFLETNECDYLQGYWYSKPLSAEEFGDLLKNGPKLE